MNNEKEREEAAVLESKLAELIASTGSDELMNTLLAWQDKRNECNEIYLKFVEDLAAQVKETSTVDKDYIKNIVAIHCKDLPKHTYSEDEYYNTWSFDGWRLSVRINLTEGSGWLDFWITELKSGEPNGAHVETKIQLDGRKTSFLTKNITWIFNKIVRQYQNSQTLQGISEFVKKYMWEVGFSMDLETEATEGLFSHPNIHKPVLIHKVIEHGIEEYIDQRPDRVVDGILLELCKLKKYKTNNGKDDKLEAQTEHNTKVVAEFMEHCKEEGYELPDSLFESYFKA